uniref:Uncharacterized protein n=1 Tax=Kalanchoe fedtschenkoi TaxID=63787 RepID=A0A7N0VAR5_KALFE
MAAENNNQVTNLPEGLVACSPASFVAVQMALKAAIELNVFNIMAESGPLATQLSALQIASKIPTANTKAVTSLHRILRFLSVNSFLTTSLPLDSDREEDRLFGLTAMTASMLVSNAGTSMPFLFLLNTEKAEFESLDKLKNFVLDPDGATCPFEMAQGRPDSRLSKMFGQTMGISNKMFFDKMMMVYGGFSEVEELMDVGGNEGSTRFNILSHLNHVAGDMFETLPNSKTILLKWILHNWTDEKCVKLLQNCWRALPQAGVKVIVLEMVAMYTVTLDFAMLTKCGGKERTISELRGLALAAGFSNVNIFPTGNNGIHVLEFLKSSE